MVLRAPSIPVAFIQKRLHSFTGLWLVGFLIIHLLTNSQSALYFGDDGSGFIRSVNNLNEIPYLSTIEIIFLAIPFLIHIWWGVQYLFTGEFNSNKTDGTKPSLPEYPRNHAYTWQRITSWILLVLITLHVIHMRFLERPDEVRVENQKYYLIKVKDDAGLTSLSKRLDFSLLDTQGIKSEMPDLVETKTLKSGEFLAVTKSFGTAELLMVRNAFKMPLLMFLYAVLVLSACFHAFNGLWTFCISWGITLSPSSQKNMRRVATFFMFLIGFLGFAAIFGTYLNLQS